MQSPTMYRNRKRCHIQHCVIIEQVRLLTTWILSLALWCLVDRLQWWTDRRLGIWELRAAVSSWVHNVVHWLLKSTHGIGTVTTYSTVVFIRWWTTDGCNRDNSSGDGFLINQSVRLWLQKSCSEGFRLWFRKSTRSAEQRMLDWERDRSTFDSLGVCVRASWEIRTLKIELWLSHLSWEQTVRYHTALYSWTSAGGTSFRPLNPWTPDRAGPRGTHLFCHRVNCWL